MGMASADSCAHHLQILYFIVEIFARSTNMGTFDRHCDNFIRESFLCDLCGHWPTFAAGKR